MDPPRCRLHRSYLLPFRLQTLRGDVHGGCGEDRRDEAFLYRHRKIHGPKSKGQMGLGAPEVLARSPYRLRGSVQSEIVERLAVQDLQ